jgi:hypothetical protein
VAFVRTNISEEHIASIFRVKIINELILFVLNMGTIRSSETSALTRATQHHILEDDIHHIHRRENLKCYIIYDVLKSLEDQIRRGTERCGLPRLRPVCALRAMNAYGSGVTDSEPIHVLVCECLRRSLTN